MEKVWCGARGKAMKGANTFFAQDAESKALIYANADVLAKTAVKKCCNSSNIYVTSKGD